MRFPRMDLAVSWRFYTRIRKTGKFSASPPIVLAGGFAILIGLGTVLLLLPVASVQPLGFTRALFMATSAVTVTGLTVIDVASSLTLFGQSVLLVLVQVGGLGFVTLAVVAMLTLGKRISLRQQGVVLEAFNQTSVAKIRQTAFAVFKLGFLIELIAAVLLTLYWWPEKGLVNALYRGVFHSVMAFNNSGFIIQGTDLVDYVGDAVPVLITTALIVTGGIGFIVLDELYRKRRWKSLSVYTRSIILATVGLDLLGFTLFWLFEFNNGATLGNLSFKAQALAAWLQSITVRTAGFASIDISHLTDSSTLVAMAYMFIGGGSLSTASGIKVGTFVILMTAAFSYLSSRSEVVLFERSIPPAVVQKSLALLLLTTALIFMGTLVLTITEHQPFIDVLFEAISAFSTTGLSRDLTPHLSVAGQYVVMVLMFVGRLGPLTFIYSLSTQKQSLITYPETQYQVG